MACCQNWQIADCGSRNGTLIAKNSAPQLLNDGDIIHVGVTSYITSSPVAQSQQLLPKTEQRIARTISMTDDSRELREQLSGPVNKGDVRALLRFFAQTSKNGLLILKGGKGAHENPQQESGRILLEDGLPRFATRNDNSGFRALREIVWLGAENFAFSTAAEKSTGIGEAITADAAEIFYDLKEQLDKEQSKTSQAGHVSAIS